jgi:hypothetical protein
MQQLNGFMVMVVALSGLIGCGKIEPKKIVQTVDWYKVHAVERSQVLQACGANPGELMATPDCVNASRASSAVMWGAKGGGVATLKPLSADQLNK